jgi:hypothetical protein
MSLSDRLRQVQERINARRLERQAKQQSTKSGGVGDTYNPVLGTQQVRDAQGGIISATDNIAAGGVGVGTPVQITQNDSSVKGAVIDAKPSRGGADSASASSREGRGAPTGGSGGSNTFNPSLPGGIPGFDPNLADGGYEPDESGACVFKTWPKGKRPSTAYETAKECLDDQAPGDWICQDGVCVEAPPGQGKYVYKRECEAKVKKPNFVGGQCAILYRVRIRLNNTLNPNTFAPGPATTGFVTVRGPLSLANNYTLLSDNYAGQASSWTGGLLLTSRDNLGGPVETNIFTNCITWGEPPSESMEVEPADPNQEDNCGDPPGQCGTD